MALYLSNNISEWPVMGVMWQALLDFVNNVAAEFWMSSSWETEEDIKYKRMNKDSKHNWLSKVTPKFLAVNKWTKWGQCLWFMMLWAKTWDFCFVAV